MSPEEHEINLGGLVSNFHSLEFVLRIFLNRLPGARPMGIPYGTDIYSLPVGADLPENDLTSYESLGELISRYNNEVLKQNFGRKIDPALVQIRDAIAHGRVSTTDTAKPLRLLKFDRPSRECRVRISFNQELTEVWFKEQKRRTNEAIHIVHASYVKLTGDL